MSPSIDDKARNLGDTVDRLISVQFFMSGGGSAHTSEPISGTLYDAARRKSSAPLSYLGAKALIDSTGDSVLITTGLVAPPFMEAEGDGPHGAVALARAVDVGLEVTPVIVCEASLVDAMQILCRAAGLSPAPLDLAFGTPRKVAIVPFPLSEAGAEAASKRILDECRPRAVVAIEKLAKNDKGVYHNGHGIDVSSVQAKVDVLFEQAAERGVCTIGIGDGGNEIGMATIADEVKEHVPTGADCGCPCGGGIASATATNVCVFGSKSNYGAFAVEACMAALLSRPEVFHSREVDVRIYEAGALLGLVDPATGLAFGWDEYPSDCSAGMMVTQLIRYMLNMRIIPDMYEGAIMRSSARWGRERSWCEKLTARWAPVHFEKSVSAGVEPTAAEQE